jgi:hypothetical protein
MKIRSWTQLVKDRKKWSEIVEQAKTHTGLWCEVSYGRPVLPLQTGPCSRNCFGSPLSFILLTWFNYFCFYCSSFFSTASTLSSKIYSFLLWPDKFYPDVQLMYEGVSKSFRTESITKYMLTKINIRLGATQRIMAAKLTRLTHKISIQLHLVAENYTICSSSPRRPVRKLLDTP